MSLIANLSQTEGKKPYREYTLFHGIEQKKVLVPVAESSFFEDAFNNSEISKMGEIIELVSQYGGNVVE